MGPEAITVIVIAVGLMVLTAIQMFVNRKK